MALLSNASIDVQKITKKKILTKGKGQYLQISIATNNETNTYGQNVAIYETQTKEEREAGMKRKYIGNGKVVWTDGEAPSLAEKKEDTADTEEETQTSDLPF